MKKFHCTINDGLDRIIFCIEANDIKEAFKTAKDKGIEVLDASNRRHLISIYVEEIKEGEE